MFLLENSNSAVPTISKEKADRGRSSTEVKRNEVSHEGEDCPRSAFYTTTAAT